MIAFIIEEVIGKIVGLFMSQRWYMAIMYTFALLALVATTIWGVGYLILLWLFRVEEFGRPLMIAISVGGLVFLIVLWTAFSMLQRRVFR